MASPTADLQAYAQSIYLAIKNRYYDEIEGADGQVYIDQVIDNTNMFVDELENEVDNEGQIVDWWFTRQNGYALGTAVEGSTSITAPSTIYRLLTDEQRYVQILQDGTPVSNWAVVNPKDITNKVDRITEDMCAMVGGSIVFSRPFRDTEANGSIIGDVSLALPRLSRTNVKLLTMVKPKLLLILGVSKNSTLPDIVQGKLSPSYVQKFNDLLQGAIARSNASSRAPKINRDNYSHVRGVY